MTKTGASRDQLRLASVRALNKKPNNGEHLIIATDASRADDGTYGMAAVTNAGSWYALSGVAAPKTSSDELELRMVVTAARVTRGLQATVLTDSQGAAEYAQAAQWGEPMPDWYRGPAIHSRPQLTVLWMPRDHLLIKAAHRIANGIRRIYDDHAAADESRTEFNMIAKTAAHRWRKSLHPPVEP